MKIRKDIQMAAERLGIQKLRKIQDEPIKAILNEEDVFVIAPTGVGKSAVFQVATLVRDRGITLVIEPTLSLIRDQVKKLGTLGIGVASLTGKNQKDIPKIREQATSGRIKFLYITPEQLRVKEFNKSLKFLFTSVTMVVVDEAHCVFEWGYGFRPAYLSIGTFIQKFRHRPTIVATTATAPPLYRENILAKLEMAEETEVFVHSLAKPQLSVILRDINPKLKDEKLFRHKLKLVEKTIEKYREQGSVIIYCVTQSDVAAVHNYVSKQFKGMVAKCSSSMDQELREKEEKQFLSGKKTIMVATSAFGMGVDKSDVRLVIHFSVPLSVVDWYQQIGRAGRDGEQCRAVLLHSPQDDKTNFFIAKKSDTPEWSLARAEEMVEMVSHPGCIMQQVLFYLGDDDAKACNRCSRCQKRRA